ncbi:hypothetical protein B0A48_17387 [Cryoendolithus antarcticus]|uniref:Uncharacterized protein n=1 Tax=Cryoendolithus antarcticus TaxID=1507870 RepID=A0A1V8SCQ8_9PEZI|nr:hypothetical protein B0A48_17387 [Cryoendolithus antarcticus]
MTNHLVGDVYQKVIEEVVAASTNDFEESGVGQATLEDLRQEWQRQLSMKRIATMPWDPKPAPVQPAQSSNPPMQSSSSNGLPSNPYTNGHSNGPPNGAAGYPNAVQRMKPEAPSESQYHGLPQMNNYQQIGPNQGGMHRAQQLVEQQFGAQAAASIQRGGLALPGQQKPPQGLQMPGQNPNLQHQYAHQQQQQALRQQQQLQQQQQHPRIKMENNSPSLPQGQYQQQRPESKPAYGQTDGADEAMDQWNAMLAQRRAAAAEDMLYADHMMRDRILAQAEESSRGLMMPLEQHEARQQKRKRAPVGRSAVSAGPAVPQYDGNLEIDDDRKPIKDESGALKDEDDDDEDADAINSDLDDPEDELNAVDNDDDESGDSILCTYDKVQRVKNKWKCTLKDGVLSTGGKEYLFNKGTATAQHFDEPPRTTSVLLVVVAGLPRSDLTTYIETALRRDNGIRSITILGSEEQQPGLKLLKMNLYALLGRIGRGASVEVVLRRHWTSEDVSQRLSWSIAQSDVGDHGHKELAGVICDVAESVMATEEVLDMDSGAFESAWKRSVGFLHAVAHGVVSSLRNPTVDTYGRPTAPDANGRRFRPFLAVTIPPASDTNPDFYLTAVRSLLDRLGPACSDVPLDVGYADELLIPEPIVEPTTKPPLLAPMDGWNDNDDGLSGGESPTKLWAAASEMGYF